MASWWDKLSFSAPNEQTAKQILTGLGLLAVLAIAAFLRLYRIEEVPGWYNDEGTLVHLAINLNQGNLDYFGIRDGILLVARPPLFIWLLSLLFKVFSSDIVTLRVFTGVLGVLNTALVFFALRRSSRSLALVCALAMAMMPKAIIYARIGFGYNLAATFILLSFWNLRLYLDTSRVRYAVISSLMVGLGVISELAVIAFIPVIFIVLLWRNWRHFFMSFPLTFLPLMISFLLYWIFTSEAFLFDMEFFLTRVSANQLTMQIMLVLIDSGVILQDIFIWVGVMGVFLLLENRLKLLTGLFIAIPFIIITRTYFIGKLGWYYIIPLFAFFAIGFGQVVYKFIYALRDLGYYLISILVKRLRLDRFITFQRWARSVGVVGLLLPCLVAPICVYLYSDLVYISQDSFPTGLEEVLLPSHEAREVAEFINARVNSGDLTLASPALAWALNGNVSDYQISIAARGWRTIHFPGNIPKERFVYEVDYSQAKYIIIDNIWKNWAVHSIPELEGLMAHTRNMYLVFQSENFMVYANQPEKD